MSRADEAFIGGHRAPEGHRWLVTRAAGIGPFPRVRLQRKARFFWRTVDAAISVKDGDTADRIEHAQRVILHRLASREEFLDFFAKQTRTTGGTP